ncbi:uncharacterized protein LOC124429244 [Vespa crabro]|uniref:uncharacterized protein LOC124429244 n=1 Tax=Vespa crabro TaxID=7445 RepID=UPI001EFFC956|nr:uncharacterized protein LOC124429244 [Vespa crabro]
MREYRSSLRDYSKALRRAKLESWRKFVTKQGNAEPWGYIYKQQAGKLRVEKVINTLKREGGKTMDVRDTARVLLDTHVPDDCESEDMNQQRAVRNTSKDAPETADAPPFTMEKVTRVIKSLKNGKAPRPVFIEVSVQRMPPMWYLPIHLERGLLKSTPQRRGQGREKPQILPAHMSSLVRGKSPRKATQDALNETSLVSGKLLDKQYGIVPERFTEDAIVEMRRIVSASSRRYVIALLFDISGAFDNVWWPLVLKALRD